MVVVVGDQGSLPLGVGWAVWEEAMASRRGGPAGEDVWRTD